MAPAGGPIIDISFFARALAWPSFRRIFARDTLITASLSQRFARAAPSIFASCCSAGDVGLYPGEGAWRPPGQSQTNHLHNGEEQMSSTTPSTEDMVRAALAPMMSLPASYRDLLLKDQITDQNDWNEASDRIAEAATASGCELLQGYINPFWANNQSFGDMLDSIASFCAFNP
jgi:hypothetical protein